MELEPITRRIDRLRGRVRFLFLLTGLSRVVCAAAALLLLSFLLDYTLELPLTVRVVSFFVALLAVIVVAIRRIVYPLSVRLSDDDFALAAEARLPELRDRLISALQFRRQLADPENAESPEMMRAVIEDASRLERAIEVRRLTDMAGVGRHGLAAAASVLLLLLLPVFAPGAARTWLHRNLLLADVPWPRSTTLVVTGFGEGREKVVTRGEPVRISVRAEGKVPDDVEIWYERLEGEGSRAHRRMYEEEGHRGLYRFDFRQVTASFRFWVEGGDDTDGEPVYTVRALVPPLIERIEARCVFPEYTRMDPETYREGDLDLPLGTKVTLVLGLNMPVRTASFVAEGKPPRAMRLSADRRTATLPFSADRTFGYVVRLEGKDGQRSLPGSTSFRIRAVPDQRPSARMLSPESRQWYTPKGLVPFKVLATDNYGVTRTSLLLKRSRDREFAIRPFRPEELHAGEGDREVVAYAAIEVGDLSPDPEEPLRVGEDLVYLAETEDNNGNRDRTDEFRIQVVSDEALERALAQRQVALREDAMNARREKQEPAHRQVLSLIDYLEKEGAFETRDRESLRDVQILQGQVTREMDRVFGKVTRVFNAYVYNRLATPGATEQILLLFDDFLRHDHRDLSTVFKRDLYRQVIAAWRDDRIHDQQILSILIEIMEITLKIAEKTSPEAHRLLAGLARGEPEKGELPDLRRVSDLQTDILGDFRVLDRKMAEWEQYSDLVDMVRELKELQGGVRTGAEKILKEK